jgi:enoyl-CoA hydratase
MAGPQVADHDGVRRVVLDRPEQLHALTPADVDAAHRALTEPPADVGAVVVTSADPRAFSAGVHTDVFRGLDVAGARDFITRLAALLEAARCCPVATVAAVNGYCLGGAMELAAACDLRVAGTGARFGMPEITVGIPSVLDAALLPQHLGLSLAKEMVLTGDLYDVDSLRGTGFLNRVVAPEEVLGTAESLARSLAGHVPAAVASQKRLFEVWQNVGLRDSVQASIGEFAQTFADPVARARIDSYRRRE